MNIRIIIALVLGALFAETALPAEPILIVTPTGYYRVEVVDGVPKVWQYSQVIELANGERLPEPLPPPPINDDSDTDLTYVRAESARLAREIGDPEMARILAEAIKAAERTPGVVQAAIIAALQQHRDREQSDRWFFEFRRPMDQVIQQAVDEGRDYEGIVDSVVRGLMDAAG